LPQNSKKASCSKFAIFNHLLPSFLFLNETAIADYWQLLQSHAKKYNLAL
jgi:hypothetical protein